MARLATGAGAGVSAVCALLGSPPSSASSADAGAGAARASLSSPPVRRTSSADAGAAVGATRVAPTPPWSRAALVWSATTSSRNTAAASSAVPQRAPAPELAAPTRADAMASFTCVSSWRRGALGLPLLARGGAVCAEAATAARLPPPVALSAEPPSEAELSSDRRRGLKRTKRWLMYLS
eukprot:scaffold58805_cov25-Tisochrysis_lutea.AAC.5